MPFHSTNVLVWAINHLVTPVIYCSLAKICSEFTYTHCPLGRQQRSKMDDPCTSPLDLAWVIIQDETVREWLCVPKCLHVHLDPARRRLRNTGAALSHLEYHLFFFWPHLAAFRILVPWPGIKPVSLGVEPQSPNHWTTGELPWVPSFNDALFNLCLNTCDFKKII